MNLYKISKGQLIILLVVGAVFWVGDALIVLDSHSPSGFSLSLLALIPGILVFYSLGWKNTNKNIIKSDNVEKVASLKSKLKNEINNDVEIKFFSVTTKKLIVMSIATLGLYEIYWFYKNWKVIKEVDKSNISPFWRSIFTVFFCYSLFKKVLASSLNQGYKEVFYPSVLASVYIILLLLGSTSGNSAIIDNYALSTSLFLISFLTIAPLLRVQKAINFNNAKIDSGYGQENKFSGLEIFFVIIGSIMIFGILIPY